MPPESDELEVVVSDNARRTLDEIWDWNAERYGATRAHAYINFLLSETDKLSRTYRFARSVPGRPHFKYVIIRRRRGGAGHVVVFEVMPNRIVVLQYFHTAQDWGAQLD